MISHNKAIQYYQLAQQVANIFSKDPSTKVGAVLLAPDSYQVLSLGYNGMPRGIDEKELSKWERPTKYQYVEHAERNALYNACRHGTPLQGSIAVVTLFPCCDCARGLIQSGVKYLVTAQSEVAKDRWSEQWKSSEAMLIEAGVEIIILTSDDYNKSIDVTMTGVSNNVVDTVNNSG
jgi:dCMP deaminase